MQEFLSFWQARSNGQKAKIILGFLISFLMIFAFIAVAGRKPMTILYSGMDSAQAGAIITEIEQSGISYEVRGDSIWVDSQQRDELRMQLAAKNLPPSNAAGYEILDDMSGFGTTSQMFDAAYWRAKEGELARTILTLPNVDAARVHLTAPRNRGYRAGSRGAASVTLVTNGAQIAREQARSLRFLIASAVPGLLAEDVSVIDSVTGVIPLGEDRTATDRASEMKQNVERILIPHVGAGNAIVELHLDIITEVEELTERSIDPKNRALISQESEEVTDESSNSPNTAVTAASNLPDGPQQAGDQQKSQRAQTRQRANYEISTLTRQVQKKPGDIRRMTVAVLVNGIAELKEDGSEVVVPRSEAELSTIRELVAAAVGFDPDRGDDITVKSLPFEKLTAAGTAAERSTSLLDRLAINTLARIALIGFFATLTVFLTLRALGSKSILSASEDKAELDESGVSDALPELTMGTEPDMDFSAPMLEMSSADFSFDSPSNDHGDPVSRLRSLMKERQDESVRLLGGWINVDEAADS